MSDSPLPIPSGYICHTSYAVGKGRQPQQHDCPSSHPPYTATPISPPRANIYWSPSKASFCILFYLCLSLSISLSLSFSTDQPLSYSFSLPPLSVPLSHFLPSTTSARSFAANLFSVFFSASSLTFHPIFQEKEKHRTVFAPVALSRRSQLFFAILLVLWFRGKGEAQRDENSPHDSFILGNECLPRSFGNATPLTPKFEEIRGGKQHLCERTPRPE